MPNSRKTVVPPLDYDPADAARIEQLLAELRAAKDPDEKARIRATLDELIFGLSNAPD
jgi:hypothetical protein